MHSMHNGGGASNSQGANPAVRGPVSIIITDRPLNEQHQLLNP